MIVSDETSERDGVGFRIVFGSMVGLWATYFLLATLRGLLTGLDLTSEILLIRLAVTGFGIVVTLGLWLVLRAMWASPLWQKVAAILIVSMPGALLTAHFNVQAFAPINKRFIEAEIDKTFSGSDAGDMLDETVSDDETSRLRELERKTREDLQKIDSPDTLEYWRYVSDVALGRYFLLLSWGALYLARLAGAKAREAERKSATFRQAAREAELRSLRYQVNPHFLFNTLNSLSALILTGKNERAEAMVDSIANFYRQSLTSEPTADVTLDEEFALQRHYLDIEAFRFPDRLRVAISLPDDLAAVLVPGMILQPLVENSVKYAVAQSTRPVTIAISAREEYGRVVLSVEDDGPAGADAQPSGHGIGLSNVRQRIEARFGRDASIASGPTGSGYATHIRIPLMKASHG